MLYNGYVVLELIDSFLVVREILVSATFQSLACNFNVLLLKELFCDSTSIMKYNTYH